MHFILNNCPLVKIFAVLLPFFQDRLTPHPTSSSSSNLVSSSSNSHLTQPNGSSSNKSASFTDVATGVLLGGVLTQWNAGPDCWDWGMGWGWTSWNSAFCGTCAVEQAVLAHHGIGAQFAAVDAVGGLGGTDFGGLGGGNNARSRAGQGRTNGQAARCVGIHDTAIRLDDQKLAAEVVP